MPVRRRAPQRLVARRQETGVVKRYTEMGIAAVGLPDGVPRAGRAPAPRVCESPQGRPGPRRRRRANRVPPPPRTGYALPAANGLLQVVEVSLPKQKKSQAVSEFKCSVVAHKRHARAQQEPGLPHIPSDVLVHIFSFLDMRSLVAAGLVCCTCHVSSNIIPVSSGVQNSHGLLVPNSTDSVFDDPNMNWKEVFHNKYAEYINWSFASNRAVCRLCWSVLWLSNLTCAAPHLCLKNRKDGIKLVTLLPHEVACYILNADDGPSSSSDSDDTASDSEDSVPRRFWNSILTEIWAVNF